MERCRVYGLGLRRFQRCRVHHASSSFLIECCARYTSLRRCLENMRWVNKWFKCRQVIWEASACSQTCLRSLLVTVKASGVNMAQDRGSGVCWEYGGEAVCLRVVVELKIIADLVNLVLARRVELEVVIVLRLAQVASILFRRQ